MSFITSALSKERTLILMTGYSGSGKSTLAYALSEALENSQVIEGDRLREIYSQDIMHGKEGLKTNTDRLINYVIHKSSDSPYIIGAFVAPDANLREKIKNSLGERDIRYFEVFVDADIEVCEERDPNGLYARFRAGDDIRLAGLNVHYDRPQNPDFICQTVDFTIQESVQQLMKALNQQSAQ